MGLIQRWVKKSRALVNKSFQLKKENARQEICDSDQELVAPTLNINRFSSRRALAVELNFRRDDGACDDGDCERVIRVLKTLTNLTLDSVASNNPGVLPAELNDLYTDVLCTNSRIRSNACPMRFLAEDRTTGAWVSIRCFRKDAMSEWDVQRLLRGIAIMEQTANMTSIERLVKVTEDECCTFVVTELAPGDNLIELLSREGCMDEQRCTREVALPLLQAAVKLHSHGFVHRELKPEHVMCHMGAVTLLDFMTSSKKSDTQLRSGVQMEYMAPEMLMPPSGHDVAEKILISGLGSGKLRLHDAKIDVWSIGVMIYEALTGCQPFRGENVNDLIQAQAAMVGQAPGADSSCLPKFIGSCHRFSPELKDFLARIFVTDPAARASAVELLEHPWLNL